FDEDFSAEEIRGILRNAKSATLTNLSTASTTLSLLGGSAPTILYSEYGTIWLSCTGTMTNGSARIPSAVAGKTLYIRFTMAGLGSLCSVLIYASGHLSGLSGARIIASTGSDLSSISIQQSAASQGFVKLYGVDDNVWAIEDNNLLTEQPA
ncbi:hypothetical protein KAR91_01060, partial [Candidatus Pacearchaeota archaeon]|nr:hypothetical protein [Candidatus Pacearchaeota archaeon]